MRNPWKKLSSKIVYRNHWIKIREDNVIRPDGKKGIYGYLEKPPGVFVIACEHDSLYLIRQFRYVIGQVIYELPAGVAKNKNYLENARRELFEETGIRAKSWKLLGSYQVAAGHESTKIFAYVASNLDTTHVHSSRQDGDESIVSVASFSLAKIRQMMLHNEIGCGISLAALGLFFAHFDKHKQK